MRVRKMNQVDVKLHDLTKVKLKKYRLNWEETGNPVPRIRNWMERLDYQAVQRRELAKLPERTILFLEENQDTLFSDVIEKPFLLVSKMFWDVSKMYKVPVRGKEMDDKKTAMTKAVTSLFYKGLTVAQIAEELHISKRTVISRKNDAKKFGWIPFRGKFFEKSLCWTA